MNTVALSSMFILCASFTMLWSMVIFLFILSEPIKDDDEFINLEERRTTDS